MQKYAVLWMHLQDFVHHCIQLRLECAYELRIRPLDHSHEIVSLSAGRGIFRHDVLVQDIEILLISPCHPESFSLAQKGRRIVRSQLQSFVVICQRSRIIVHGHLVIGQCRQNERRRIFLIIVLKRLEGLFLPVKHTQKVEPIDGYGLGHSENGLDLLQCLQSLLVFLLRAIKLHEVEIKVAFLREVFKKLFVHVCRELRSGSDRIQPCQPVPVPEIRRIYLRGHPVALLRALKVVLHYRALSQIVPRTVILRIIGHNFLEDRHGRIDVPFIISRHGGKHHVLMPCLSPLLLRMRRHGKERQEDTCGQRHI